MTAYWATYIPWCPLVVHRGESSVSRDAQELKGLLPKPQQTKLEARNPKLETNSKFEGLRSKRLEVTVSK